MNWIVRRYLPWLLLSPLLLVAGCQVDTSADITSIPSVISPSTLAPERPTPLATSTVAVAPRQTPPKTTSPGEVEYHCIDVSDAPATLSDIDGKIVLNGEIRPSAGGRSFHNPSLLVDLQTGEQTALAPEDTPSRFAISPNGCYLAFDTRYGDSYANMRINIVDSTFTSLGEFVEETATFEWLNDEILFVHSQVAEDNPLIALYPFENRKEIIQPFVTEKERRFPYGFQMLHDWGFYGSNKIIYNPTLTHAIYAAIDGAVFHNLATGQDVYTLNTGSDWGVSPKWSPDGMRLAMGLNTMADSEWDNRKFEVLVLDESGEFLSTTQLSALSGPVYISSLSWSPDGNRIAFWYTTNEDENTDLRLAVYDTDTQRVVDYCVVKDYDYFQRHRSDTSPIWSPDGNSLLISKTTNPYSNPSVIIVDLENERAAVVMTGYEPVGWMK